MSLKEIKRKPYNIERSPFYKIQSPHVLSRLLGVNIGKIAKNSNFYNKYYMSKTPKGIDSYRETQTPYGDLRRVHDRIHNLMKRISVPEFLHSGIKGRSYITNARSHQDSSECFCLDIVKFFPSTTRSHVFGFFANRMRCKPDVAAVMANICTVDGYLPTGSPLSTLISYFVHSEMFEQLSRLSQSYQITMTLVVDDIVFSGERIPKGFQHEVKRIIQQRGLRSHKYRCYYNNDPKEITGIIVHCDHIGVPQRRHLGLYQRLVALWNSRGELETLNNFRRALGHLSEGSQIESRIAERKMALMAAKKNIFMGNSIHQIGKNIGSSLITRSSSMIKLVIGALLAIFIGAIAFIFQFAS